MLAQAERQAHRRLAKRRVLTLFVPGAVTSLWAMLDLLGARADRMEAAGAGFFAVAFGSLLVIAWTVLFVVLPLYGAVKADPLPSGAALAFAAGPVLSPMLFGAGGWKVWQIVVLFAICGSVLGAIVERARARRG